MAEPELFQKKVDPKEHVKENSLDEGIFGKISTEVNNLSAGLKILEERFANLRNKNQLSEQNLIELDKDLREDIKLLTEDIVELKGEAKDIKEKLMLITKEITNLVKKDDFTVVERYIDMWQPMNFVTLKELNKLIEDYKSSTKEKS